MFDAAGLLNCRQTEVGGARAATTIRHLLEDLLAPVSRTLMKAHSGEELGRSARVWATAERRDVAEAEMKSLAGVPASGPRSKQSLRDQLAQINKALGKPKANVAEFTTSFVAGKDDLAEAASQDAIRSSCDHVAFQK